MKKRLRDRWRRANQLRRIGGRNFMLAGLLAILPLAAIAAIAHFQAKRAFTESAESALLQTAQAYSRQLGDRMITASREVASLALADPAIVDSSQTFLAAYAVFGDDGTVVRGELGVPDAILAEARQNPGTSMLVDTSAADPLIFFVSQSGNRTAIGLARRDFLQSGSEFPAPVGVCIFTEAGTQPAYCSDQSARDLLAAVPGTERGLGTVRIESAEQALYGAFREIPETEALDRPVITTVASLPGDVALAAFVQLQELLTPAVVVIAALTLLCAMLYALRIQNPVARMLEVTEELTKKDIWGRSEVRRQRKYAGLGTHLQSMAEDLAQRFNARETLSDIDQVILSGADTSTTVELVLRHIVENLKCRRATVTIIDPKHETRATTVSMSHGHPVARNDEVEIDEAARLWLASQKTGTQLSDCSTDEGSQSFVAADLPYTYVLPLLVDGESVAAVSIMTADELDPAELDESHIQDLVSRLTVALEAVSRSERLQRKAFFDDLTGLPNREFCFARLDRALEQAKHLESSVAVMFIDLDGFKNVNDSLGHIAGDELIRQAAYRLSSCVSESGTVGRLGGDEFAVVLPFPVDASDPEDLSRRLIEAIAEPFQVGNSEIYISASVGVARYPRDGESRSELLRKADTAMYRAKEHGRGRCINYTDTMSLKIDARLQMESELRRALDNDEFRIYYQPQMDMNTGRIVSAEALVRWAHPERGLVPPGEFIPVAEEAGYITVLGSWVMSNACKQLAQWRNSGFDLKRIAVNVSARQFRRYDFIEVVESCLVDLLADASSLEIELTESVFVDDLTAARKTLERLKATGVFVSIDDFGTGYSSLGYLKHLTFDAVKIDQSFVRELPDDRESEAIVRAVLAMCHTLDKHVVAEGIETNEQFRHLRNAGIDIGQGYLIGKPMPAEHFSRYMTMMEQRLQARRARPGA